MIISAQAVILRGCKKKEKKEFPNIAQFQLKWHIRLGRCYPLISPSTIENVNFTRLKKKKISVVDYAVSLPF